MTREQRIAELQEAGIMCSPEKADQATIACACAIAAFVIVVFGAIFGERPVQKPAQSTTTEQVATTSR